MVTLYYSWMWNRERTNTPAAQGYMWDVAYRAILAL